METKNKFSARHIGPREQEIDIMLKSIGVKSLDMLIEQTVPASICLKEPMAMSQEGMTEYEYLNHIRRIAKKNKIFRSFIGQVVFVKT
ncbi:MAG: hypothetical protein PHU27_12540 [Salinivirgaceae bacterium]|nr:hypothetical protein [Salinivirgaceae bacterium]